MRDANTDWVAEELTAFYHNAWKGEPEMMLEFMAEEGMAVNPRYKSENGEETACLYRAPNGILVYAYFSESCNSWGAKY